MHIVDIYYPGTWLDLSDEEIAMEIRILLGRLEDSIVKAAVSLSLFEESRGRGIDRAEWDHYEAIWREVEEKFRKETGDLFRDDFVAFVIGVERAVRKRKIELGIEPRSYTYVVPFLHSHSFVYAVDTFGKVLDALCDYKEAPEKVREIRDYFNAKLPAVRKIRNSALHIEDRSRRYASQRDKQRGKKMKVDSFLGLSNLEGERLCYTIDDGSYQCIGIAADTLEILVDAANKVLASFQWKGPPHIEPLY